jgi:predicted RNA binding protein YcfA (HicA-like mRNA interferase family)
MPLKIRQVKAILKKAGFYFRPGKGSHTVWKHLSLPGFEITLAGHDGDDAKPYNIKDLRDALKRLEEI